MSSLGGLEETFSFLRDASLGDVQQVVCRRFGRRFPATKAKIMVGDHLYDEFMDKPFLSCAADGDCAVVTFAATDDPHMYDKFDRARLKIDIEEEVAYDIAAAAAELEGAPPIDELEAWVMRRRLGELGGE